MHILSKSTYIKGLQCEKALYMQKKHPYLRDKLSIEQRAKFQRGTDVGVLAHEVFPGGIDMSPNSPSQFPKKVQETWNNLSNPEVKVMYEAVFQYNDTLIMLDILVRDGDKWLAVEVKSSMRLSDTYYNDAALQYYVLHGCGVPLSDFRLMYLNGDYVKDDPIDVQQLFKMESVMEYVIEREVFVAENVERLKKVIAQPHSPLVNIGTQCNNPYPCDFQGHCWKLIPKNSFLFTTAIDDEVLFQSYFNGVSTNAKMLQQIEPDSEEAHQIEALETNSYYIDYKTLYSLAPQPKPKSIAYLNLLLYRPAVPELDGTKPYEEMILAFALQGEYERNAAIDPMPPTSQRRDDMAAVLLGTASTITAVGRKPSTCSSRNSLIMSWLYVSRRKILAPPCSATKSSRTKQWVTRSSTSSRYCKRRISTIHLSSAGSRCNALKRHFLTTSNSSNTVEFSSKLPATTS